MACTRNNDYKVIDKWIGCFPNLCILKIRIHVWYQGIILQYLCVFHKQQVYQWYWYKDLRTIPAQCLRVRLHLFGSARANGANSEMPSVCNLPSQDSSCASRKSTNFQAAHITLC